MLSGAELGPHSHFFVSSWEGSGRGSRGQDPLGGCAFVFMRVCACATPGASRELCCDASVSQLSVIVTKIPGVINTKEETFISAQVFVGFF